MDLGYEYAENFGITTLTDTDKNLSLALGGLTKGVTNIELTGAYATIANGGTYLEPKLYTVVYDHDGNVLLDKSDTQDTRQVLKDTTAWLLTDAMKDVMTSGTGTRAYFGSTMAQAGKSGTTTSNRDCLWAGYTPYYTCVVWGGYDDNSKQAGSNTTYPKNIWKAVMSRVHEGLEYKDFPAPSGITSATVCSKSGLLPIEGTCDSDPRGSMLITEYFDASTVPSDLCDHHVTLTICNDTGTLANAYCPNTTTSVYIVGGEEGTADSNYLAREDLLNSQCTIQALSHLQNQQLQTRQQAVRVQLIPARMETEMEIQMVAQRILQRRPIQTTIRRRIPMWLTLLLQASLTTIQSTSSGLTVTVRLLQHHQTQELQQIPSDAWQLAKLL